ncbi:uncharacterized protein LOC121778596 isoform X2 [Salvia splendens]|uniref:uncharacterized protein LOC121778596 isoform X2 n=1 Tax=Salvia splendens TaxID=180675 RepID=UPI001C257C27|nr:uncharacterized protein LOC121778596 isoform X2 [Salvia splendens]
MAASQARKAGLPIINLLRVKGMPILQQLHLEERLLRTSSQNWCIINDGTTRPTIVMGVSGKAKELLETDAVLRDEIPVIRRFTGGGTVIVDQGTIFVTFICNKDAISGLQSYPRPIMSWSSLIYKNMFQGIGEFSLRENDYVIGNHKFGGNAQSITKNRNHAEFICRLKEYMSRSDFIDGTMDSVASHFALRSLDADDIQNSSSQFEPSSRILTRQELGEEASMELVGTVSQISYMAAISSTCPTSKIA